MSDEKIKLLNDVGFRWEGSRRSIQEKVQAINPSSGASEAANITSSTAGTPGTGTSESSNNNNSSSSNPSLDFSEIAAAAFANPFTLSASPHISGDPAQNTGVGSEHSRQQQSVRDVATSATQNASQNIPGTAVAQPGPQGPPDLQQLLASIGASNLASQQQNGIANANSLSSIQQLGPLLNLSQQLLAASTNAAMGTPQAPSLEQLVSSILLGGQQNVVPMQAQQPMWQAAFNPMAAGSVQQQQQQLQPGNISFAQMLSSLGAPAALQVPQGGYQQILQQAALQALSASGSAANAAPTAAGSNNQLVLVVPLNGSTAQPSLLQMTLPAAQAAAGVGGGPANPFVLNVPQYMVGNPQATAPVGSGTADAPSGTADAPFQAGMPTNAGAAPALQQQPGAPAAPIANQVEDTDGASISDQQQQREAQGPGAAAGGRGVGPSPNLDPPVN